MHTDTRTYSIAQLAQEFEISTRTLRFYEEKGLLRPARIKQSRVYSSKDRTRLRLILRGKRLGLSLDESSAIIDMYDPASGNHKQIQALLERIQQKKAQLLAQKQDLEQTIADLERSELRCRTVLKHNTNEA